MIGRNLRGVHQTRAFAQHLDARGGLAAHHRAAGAAAEGVGVDAGNAAEGVAQRRLTAVHQVVAAQQGDVRSHIVACPAQGQGAHHDVGDLGRLVLRLDDLVGGEGGGGKGGGPGGGQQEGLKSQGTHPRYNVGKLDML
ncbi:hypothetical protein D3C81_1097380 [compost metagenome]